ncbi:MAG TPA: YegS/Rv2252/BmrU family lipid kinase [Gemmatimonadaceae bacterium]|nr:YegS/Rv2252/BmrU family lipid kinase [Gemmatimonadaceae bacterium]
MDTTWVIANPAAGRGTSRPRLGALREEFLSAGVRYFSETRSAGDEESLANRAIDGGAHRLVVIGGDGTCARVASAILNRQSDCALAVIPVGTGNDFAKTLGVAGLSRAGQLGVALNGTTHRIDVGRAETFHFINSCGFGFDASVLEASNRVRWLKGNAVYLYAAVAQLLSYKGTKVSVDSEIPSTRLMITVSNGRFLGGAFRIAPSASVVDGLLDVNFIDNCGVLERIRIFAGAIRGTHGSRRAVQAEKRNSLKLEFAEPPLMEIDGELSRASSNTVTIECIPRAVSVIAAPTAVL